MGETDRGPRTVRIIATIEQASDSRTDLRVLAGPVAAALAGTGAHVRMTTFEPDDEIMLGHPYPLTCPLCDGPVVAAPSLEVVVIECHGTCKRAWHAPRRGRDATETT